MERLSKNVDFDFWLWFVDEMKRGTLNVAAVYLVDEKFSQIFQRN